MTIPRSWLGTAAVVVLVAGAFILGPQCFPGWQLERSFNRLLDAVERRQWDRVEALMADDYRDGWGFDRPEALAHAQEAMRHFFTVDVQALSRRTQRTGRTAEISARLQLSGRGTAVAEVVTDRVNHLTQDFRFAWKRESWEPWSWKLHAVNQPEIDPSWMP